LRKEGSEEAGDEQEACSGHDGMSRMALNSACGEPVIGLDVMVAAHETSNDESDGSEYEEDHTECGGKKMKSGSASNEIVQHYFFTVV
jgi:hypothetical protein